MCCKAKKPFPELKLQKAVLEFKNPAFHIEMSTYTFSPSPSCTYTRRKQFSLYSTSHQAPTHARTHTGLIFVSISLLRLLVLASIYSSFSSVYFVFLHSWSPFFVLKEPVRLGALIHSGKNEGGETGLDFCDYVLRCQGEWTLIGQVFGPP